MDAHDFCFSFILAAYLLVFISLSFRSTEQLAMVAIKSGMLIPFFCGDVD